MCFNSSRLLERQQMNVADYQKEVATKQAKDDISLVTYQKKQMLKEQERERRKAQFEQIQISDGRIEVATRNLLIQSQPRIVTNLSSPKLTPLKRVATENVIAYRINLKTDNKEKEVFLDKAMSGNATYLLKKFAEEGIVFYAPSAKKKEYVIQIWGLLLSLAEEEEWIADHEGWVKLPDGKWKYFSKGDITWEKIKKLSSR